ncbi:glycosyltransferase [Flammeovirgaceae bacterium SG7u.111]|nr:glycosyltransferase [Flammeovirgaceae bacterium SG7u.132]WPO34972.1 glycosyltransferase [Flammeovirgaceae bacterium SG7u.111]
MGSEMKILHINTYDRGGAANACTRLHLGLLEKGVESKLLLKQKTKNLPSSFVYVPPPLKQSFLSKVIRKGRSIINKFFSAELKEKRKRQFFLNKRSKKLEMFSFPYTDFDITTSPLYQEADIIHLHWTANFLDYYSFFRKNKKPVIWTIVDENPYSGGEHYREYYSDINEKGELLSREITDIEQTIFSENQNLKIKALEGVKNLHIAAMSDWLVTSSKKSPVFNQFPHLKLGYGANPNIYHPRNIEFTRDIFGLPKDRKVVLFLSSSLKNPRKGYGFLIPIIQEAERQKLDVTFCTVGNDSRIKSRHKNVMQLDYIHDELLLSLLYAACDVILIPSLMDNLPYTLIEALLCGTPCIGFPVGGIEESITHKKNGLLCDEVSSESLKHTFFTFLNEGVELSRDEIASEARKIYDYKIHVNAYIETYKKLLN